MRFAGGWLQIGKWRGVPIKAHWSTPIGPILFSRFEWEPGIWVGVIVLILLHEVGHAVLARARGMHVTQIRLHMLGGECGYSGWPTPIDTSIIAWGGVLAQGVGALAALAFLTLGPPPTGIFTSGFAYAFTWANLYIAVLNLLPIPGLDGWEAWQLFTRLPWKTWRRRLTPRRDKAKPEDIIAKALEKARAESRARRKDSLH